MTDRTIDFQRIVQSLGGSIEPQGYKKKNTLDATPKTKNAFNEAASEIAKGIHKTSSMLTKLTNLVRKQGLFDDPTEEINSLIFRIKQDLDELNSKCDTAQQFIDNKKSFFGADVSQSSQHNSKVVSNLKSDLMSTTKDFKNVLELRSFKMKDQQQKKLELTGKGILSPMKSENSSEKMRFGDSSSSSLIQRKNKQPLPSPYATITEDPPIQDIASHISDQEALQEQRQLLLEPITGSQQYFEARERAVTEVEKTINELGQLFQRLATMLSEQQELVERIDEDVESAVENTDNAKNALLKAYETVSSNRGMYMKIFGILAIFILFFVLFLM